MGLKQLIPASIRNSLRPAYQQWRKTASAIRRDMSSCSLWPKPAEWHALKQRLPQVTQAEDIYRLAASEFGILQIEREIIPFLEYIASHKPVIVGEIGLKHGGNTFMFSRLFSEVRVIIALDLILQNVAKAKFLAKPEQQLYFLEGNSYSTPVIERTRSLLAGRKFDFLFIDGDHEYDGVLADLHAYYSMVRPGGLIAFHDIVPDEVARTGKRSEGSKCYGGGVYLLWQKLKERFKHREFVNDWNQNGFGIGVIEKPDDQPLPSDFGR